MGLYDGYQPVRIGFHSAVHLQLSAHIQTTIDARHKGQRLRLNEIII